MLDAHEKVQFQQPLKHFRRLVRRKFTIREDITSRGNGASSFSGTHSFDMHFSSDAYPLVAWSFMKGNIYGIKKEDRAL